MISKRLTAAALLTLVLAQPAQAGFAEVARAIDSHRGVSRIWIPFLGLARLAVWIAAPEGIHDFQLATFKGAGRIDARELQATMHAKVGRGFVPLVQVWSRKSNEFSFIYARPAGNRFELMVLAHDGDETVLVRVEIDPEVLARELENNPRSVTRVAAR